MLGECLTMTKALRRDRLRRSRMKSAAVRAREALKSALVASLPADRAEKVDAGGRTADFEDNLVGTISTSQVEVLRRQLSAGDGKELEYGPRGERPDAHAAHSSSAAAFNNFGAFTDAEQCLQLAGLSGFKDLRVEAKQSIFRGGRAPNLDCLLTGDGVVVGVESKLTEMLSPHGVRPWQEAYDRATTHALFSGAWSNVYRSAIAGEYRTRRLGVDQLLRHALGICRQNPGVERHLVYLYWEPANGSDIEDVIEHRREVEEFASRVDEGCIRFHAMTFAELWAEWEDSGQIEHVTALRSRYAVEI